MIRRYYRAVSMVAFCLLLTWGISRAAASKYQQKRQQIIAACKAEREKLTPAEQKQLAEKRNTPEISLISPGLLRPGQTMDVVISGKFPAGTKFLFGSDSIEVIKESVAANSYRATIKAAPSGGPERLAVEAFAPLSCTSGRRDGFLIAGNFEWDFNAANGWRVKARSIPAEAPANREPELGYMLEFYRGAETAPFAKRKATLNPSQGDLPSYYFSISNQDESSMNAQEEMASIYKQMANPNLSDADRDKLTKRLEAIMQNMTKDFGKMSDPAYIKQLQEKQQEFGCTAINATLKDGALSGSLRCSQKVGANIAVTGSVKYLAK